MANRARALTLNVLAMIIGKAASVIIGLAALAILTRHLGPEGFGEYRTVLTVMAFAVMFSGLGLRAVVLREISRPDADMPRIVGAGLSLRMIAVSTAVLLGAALGFLFPYSRTVHEGLLIGGLYYVFLQGSMFFWTVFLRNLSQAYLVAADVGGGLVVLAGVLYCMHTDRGVIAMLVALTAGGLVQFSLSWYFARKLTPFRPRIDPEIYRDLLRMGVALAGSEIALMAILRGDMLILSLLDSAEAVGLYGVPSKIFEILASLSVLFIGMIMPAMMSALASDDETSRRKSMGHALDVLFAYGAGLIVVVGLFAEEILTLVAGSEFSVAGVAFFLVSVAIAANALGQPCRQLLTALEKQATAFRIDLAGLGLAFTLYFTLIPKYSIVGAGIGTAITEIMLATLLALALKRSSIHGVIPPSWWKILLAAGATAAIAYGLEQLGIAWIIVMPVICVIYAIALIVSGAVPSSYLRELRTGSTAGANRETETESQSVDGPAAKERS